MIINYSSLIRRVLLFPQDRPSFDPTEAGVSVAVELGMSALRTSLNFIADERLSSEASIGNVNLKQNCF